MGRSSSTIGSQYAPDVLLSIPTAIRGGQTQGHKASRNSIVHFAADSDDLFSLFVSCSVSFLLSFVLFVFDSDRFVDE